MNEYTMKPSVLNNCSFFSYVGMMMTLMFLCVKGLPRRPPNYEHDSMPDTTFTCKDKVVGGYYADPDADCQMFHICVQVDEHDIRDFKFMCPDDTVFDQENFICANWFEIDCLSSTFYYDKNLQLFQDGDNSTASNVTEMPSELQLRQQQEQLLQLKILEDKQQEQVFKQQQIIEQHELRQQEHQRNQFKIIQEQQKQQEDQQQKQQHDQQHPPGIRAVVQAARNDRSALLAVTSTPEPDYYFYYDDDDLDDLDDDGDQGFYYPDAEFDPQSPQQIIDPGKGSPLLAASLFSKSPSL